MAPNIGVTTLGAIRAQAEALADLPASTSTTHITLTQANGWVNAAAQELYGLIVEAFGNDYFVQTPNTGYQFTTDGLTNYFSLPTDFFKLLGADVQISAGQWVPMRPFTFAERNRYAITNSSIPNSGQVVRLFYVPRFTPLVNDSDSYDGVNGWEEFIVAQTAKKMAINEESDWSGAAAIEDATRKRIEHEAENRDAGNPTHVADTRGRQSNAMMYRLNGMSQIWLIGNAFLGMDPYGEIGGGWY